MRPDDVLAMIRRAIAPIQRRVMLAVGRAVIQASKDDEGIQVVKLSLCDGELRERVERMQNYGFTSRPLDGCEATAVFVGGDRGHGLVVATDDRRHRKKGLKKGESAIYTDEGDYIHLQRGRIIEVVAGSKLQVTAPEIVADASTSVTVNTGTATVNCEEATVAASTQATIDSPETAMTGNLTVDGVITGKSGIAITGTLPSGSGGEFTGTLEITSGDVVVDGQSLKQHIHPGDSGGTTGTWQ